jgi:hypothetical protein
LCEHYIDCAECIERKFGFNFTKRPDPIKWPQFQRRKNTGKESPFTHDLKSDRRPRITMRKKNAENIIYGATMSVWLFYGIESSYHFFHTL